MPIRLFQSLFLGKSISLVIVFYFFTACGLKYVPTETPEDFKIRRQSIVEKYIQDGLANQKLVYSSVVFGETIFLKPENFKRLDSLYTLKYLNEEKGILDSKLEEQIEIQKMIVDNDTNKVSYIEDHVFSLSHGDSVDFYSGIFLLNNELSVVEISIKESIYVPNRYAELYKIYFFEESFYYPGNLPNGEEMNFYTFFKDGLKEQTASDKNAFILHTLNLMELAKIRYSIKTSDLIKIQISRKFIGGQTKDYTEKFSDILEIMQNPGFEDEKIIGYSLQYSYSKKTDSENPITNKYQITFDQYLRLKDVKKL